MISKLITAFSCLLIAFVASLQTAETVPYDKIADRIMKTTSDYLSKKHQIQLIGVKSSMKDSVKLMGLHFQVNRKLNKDEARSMIVECTQSFLANINQNEAIKKYLQIYPFDSKHIEIVIFIDRPDRGTFYYPDLAIVSVVDGKIEYTTNDSEIKYHYKTREFESFEDAVKILQNQASSNQTQ